MTIGGHRTLISQARKDNARVEVVGAFQLDIELNILRFLKNLITITHIEYFSYILLVTLHHRPRS